MNGDLIANKKELSITINEITRYASNILKSLSDRRRDNWISSSIVSGLITSLSIFFIGLFSLTQSQMGIPTFVWILPTSVFAIFTVIIGMVVGISLFLIQKRRGKNDKISEVQNLMNELNQSNQKEIEKFLRLLEGMIKLIPLIKRNYNIDALIYGSLGFFFGYVFSLYLWVGLLFGFIIAIYFKLQGDRASDKENIKYEELYRKYMQQSEELLNSL